MPTVNLQPNFNAHTNEKTENYWYVLLFVVLGILAATVSFFGLEIILKGETGQSHLTPLAWIAYPFYGILLLLKWVSKRVFHLGKQTTSAVLTPVGQIGGSVAEASETLGKKTYEAVKAQLTAP